MQRSSTAAKPRVFLAGIQLFWIPALSVRTAGMTLTFTDNRFKTLNKYKKY
jgi:hypothetical protein